MARNTVTKRTDRGNNWTKIATSTLTAILNDPYTRGLDGADYHTVRHELEQELWKRQNAEHERQLKEWGKEQKAYFKHVATSHKRAKAC